MAEEKVLDEDKPQCSKLKTLYKAYFPTDSYSYSLRMPFLGLILTILNFEIVKHGISQFDIRGGAYSFYGFYTLVAFGVSYELHYGLKTMDRTQLTPWLLLKYIEILIGIVLGLIDFIGPVYKWEQFFWYEGIITGLNIAVTRTVYKNFIEFGEKAVSEKIPLSETV